MTRQLERDMPWILVRFEQGRGKTGVPKTWIPYLVGHPDDPNRLPTLQTLVAMAVALFRIQCADENQAHGRDLMPAGDEYVLHNIDGGALAKTEDIQWQTIDAKKRTELVLTWRNPAELLMRDAPSS